MSSATAKLYQAERDLSSLRTAAAEEARQEDIRKLEETKVQGRAAEAEFHRLKSAFKRHEASCAMSERNVEGLNEQIQQARSDKPGVFASAEEKAAWESHCQSLTKRRDKALQKMRDLRTLRESTRMEALRAAARVDGLQRAVRNMISKLNGTLATGWEGGVSRVL